MPHFTVAIPSADPEHLALATVEGTLDFRAQRRHSRIAERCRSSGVMDSYFAGVERTIGRWNRSRVRLS